MIIVDYAAVLLLAALRLLLMGLPATIRVKLLSTVIRGIFVLKPSLRHVSHKNLALAFPESSQSQREIIISSMFDSIGRLISDFLYLPKITKDWVEAHVELPYWPRYLELKRAQPDRGLLLVTGHLGSFELQGYLVGILGFPISAVIRSFKLPRLNRWWNNIREGSGNHVFDRKGAFRQTLKELHSGRDVALLFDQNVTRNHAVFVDWFGKPAATSRAIALAALRTKTIALVASLSGLAHGRYRMNVIECNFDDIYDNSTLDDSKKIERITQRLADAYCQLIRQNPEGWFWMHRRWKTTVSDDVKEDFYSPSALT